MRPKPRSEDATIGRCLRALAREDEKRVGLPEGILGDRPAGSPPRQNIRHFPSDLNRAILTAEGGIVACQDAALATAIAETVATRADDDYAALLSQLQATLQRHLGPACNVYVAYALEQIADRDPGLPAAVCNLNILLYCDTPKPVESELKARVEMLRPGDIPDQHFLPEAEHVCAVREGEVIASTAWNLPRLEVEDRRFHALGVWTRRPYWSRGFGKAVVSVLVEHIASERGIPLWSTEAQNVGSLRLARSVGFLEHMWAFSWEVREGHAPAV